MNIEEFFKVEKSKNRNLSWEADINRSSACQHYVLARVAIKKAFVDSGVLLAEQSIELMLKFLIKSKEKEAHGHDLVSLLKQASNFYPDLNKLMDETTSKFLSTLTSAYNLQRFGEADFRMSGEQILQELDRIFAALYAEKTQGESFPDAKKAIYVPEQDKHLFLERNSYFTESDVTHQPFVYFGVVVQSKCVCGSGKEWFECLTTDLTGHEERVRLTK